jgi:hypothetical protein
MVTTVITGEIKDVGYDLEFGQFIFQRQAFQGYAEGVVTFGKQHCPRCDSDDRSFRR